MTDCTAPDDAVQLVTFGGLALRAGPEVIVPRGWTVAQSRWAAELARDLPPGPLLELCAGCGPIGLEAARLTGRAAVLVEASEEACRWARANTRANGLGDRVEVRHARMAEALAAGERFPLVLADPPYVPRDEVDAFPEDPVTAIDGGPDGLDPLREVAELLPDHLVSGGVALVQTRGPEQAWALADWVGGRALALRAGDVRVHGPSRALLALHA
jgi:methylase of polypeptide subunit release factors